jgi:hypothetical protein
MFYFGNKLKKPIINSELDNYIKKSLINSLKEIKENYSSNNKKYSIDSILKNIDIDSILKNIDIDNSHEYPSINNIYFILPFVSLVSFFAGYNFRSILIKTIS